MTTDVILFDEQIGQTGPKAGRHKRGALTLTLGKISAGEFIREAGRDQLRRHQAQHSDRPFISASELTAYAAQTDGPPRTEAQAADAAFDAFVKGFVLLFWNEDQITEPDHMLDLLGENEAVFVRLIPMVGG